MVLINEEDVTILLKNITGMVEPLGNTRAGGPDPDGIHYSEISPSKYPLLRLSGPYQRRPGPYAAIPEGSACLAGQIWQDKGRSRSGLLPGRHLHRRAIKAYLAADGALLAHYTISIIRGRGSTARHDHIRPVPIVGEDPVRRRLAGKGERSSASWTGHEGYPAWHPDLCCPVRAGCLAWTGTYCDLLIPSSCLNSTVSGCSAAPSSRSDIIVPQDFHGAAPVYRELRTRT